jgi:hypothetical protein
MSGVFDRPPALGANAHDAVKVVSDLKTVLGGDLVLQRLQLSRKEFNYSATLRTDHVIVVLVLVVVLVVSDAVAKADLARESGLSQQFERAINRGLPDAWIFLLYEPVEVLAGKMLLGAQKHIQNQVSLRSAFEPLLLDVLEKNFLLFSHD